MDAEVYYGANVTSDYGSYIGEGSIVTSGASVRHDERVRDQMVFEGNPGLSQAQPGISDAKRMALLGFRPKKWLAEVMGPALEKREAYDAPLDGWEHTNKGIVKGTVRPGAILVGNVNVGEGSRIFPGAYLEGNITIGKRCDIVVDVMIVSNDAIIGDHTHMYDKAMIVDGRPAATASTTNTEPDKVRIGAFSWINHLAALQGTTTGEFSLANIGVSAAFGTNIGREALLLNNSATYADQQLPARSISYGDPAKVRILDSTMREREFFFYGKSYPTWERQATEDERKSYKLPK
jgi:carbonic anhydrase/acetyltransferase-like protein (isoleucine patch superfamily)